MRIACLGTGMVGGTLARAWASAGHEVRLAARDELRAARLASDIGRACAACSFEEAARWCEVALLAVPFHAHERLGAALARFLEGKVILDAGNPFERRDGDLAQRVATEGRGSAVVTAACFPGARVVKAFNTIYYETIAAEAARRATPVDSRVAVPLAADDGAALEIAEQLVRDAGLAPVFVGPLETARFFDPGTAVWNSGARPDALRASLRLVPKTPRPPSG